MRQPSLNDLFRSFLETRVPLLFLVGSIALAILGNAIYELLTSTFGATPEFLIALVIGAVLIFIFVTVGFQQLLRTLDARKVVRNDVRPDQQAEPHAGLILPVSLTHPGPEATIIAWHQRDATLRHCWLLVTPEVEREGKKLGNLRQGLFERGVTPYNVPLPDSVQADHVYTQVQDTIRRARQLTDAHPLIADITGGTKAMTAGTLLACLDSDVAVQYLSTPRDSTGHPRRVEDALPMKVVTRMILEDMSTKSLSQG